jgi:hypothetical protein
VDEQQAAAKSAQADAKPDMVRVCTTSAADGWSVTEWRVPVLAVFEHAGILVGGIRDKWDRDSCRAETVDRSAALVTTDETVLTRERPCAEVRARMLTSATYRRYQWAASGVSDVWDFDHVLGYPLRLLAQPNKLGPLHGSIALRATALGPIQESSGLTDEAAVALEPDNPLNRIPGDMAKAEETRPPAGGNLRVCLSKDIDEESYSSVRLPEDLIFESYGRLIGDERDPQPDSEYTMFDNKQSYAVALMKPLTLTKAKPCGVTIWSAPLN